MLQDLSGPEDDGEEGVGQHSPRGRQGRSWDSTELRGLTLLQANCSQSLAGKETLALLSSPLRLGLNGRNPGQGRVGDKPRRGAGRE